MFLLLTLSNFAIYSTVIVEFEQLSSETLVSENKFVFSNWKKHIVLSAGEILFGYMFSSLFTQHKVPKRIIFMTVFQKDNLNSAIAQVSY